MGLVVKAYRGDAHLQDKTIWLKRIFILSCLAFFARIFLVITDHTPLYQRLAPSCPKDAFAWDSIAPSEQLEWTRCYEEPLECARLEVPLDYAAPHGQKAAIALLRRPSRYSADHPLWRGPILYNPGGPGPPGIAIVRALSPYFERIIGEEYDHVAFDPRGVGFTTPSFLPSLFTTDAEAKLFAMSRPPTLNSSADALARTWATGKLLGGLVQQRPSAKWVAKHMSTAIVARDMLSITRAFGRNHVQAWCFSYGTILLATFVAMFPHNVGRIVMDGVGDAENYYSGAWDNNLIDTDVGLELAISACSNSSACALSHSSPAVSENSSRRLSSAAVRERLKNILFALSHNPIATRDALNGNYALVDKSLARKVLFDTLYSPMRGNMARTFSALVAAEHGDGVPLLRLSGLDEALWRCPNSDRPSCGWLQPATDDAEISGIAIACTDAEVVRHDSLNSLREHFQGMARLSQFAELWDMHAYCAGWETRTFTANTSFPVLLVGNVADPAAPLWAAKKMSKGFNNSVVLVQNSPGHCSLSATSLCTSKAIRAYFRDGILPQPGTVCEVEDRIFEDVEEGSSGSAIDQLVQAEDQEFREAVRGASTVFAAHGPGRSRRM
ncbi:alpha/beta-hydrolase [Auriculariales sp. MPI-PUGE-AT-0066]|nr:alpha/beta-hydrolase [Auriculariales sp. MPI-PUGE-AT-0066]